MHAIVQMRVQHRRTVEQIPPLLDSPNEMKVGEAEVHSMLARMADASAPAYEGFFTVMRAAPSKQLDETRWSGDGDRRYLWVATTPREVIYRIAVGRGHVEALSPLGPTPKGVMVHDRQVAHETKAGKIFRGSRSRRGARVVEALASVWYHPYG